MAKRILTPETLNSSLWLRWPDRELIDNFKELMSTLRHYCEKRSYSLKNPGSIFEYAFKDTCKDVVKGSLENKSGKVINNMRQFDRGIIEPSASQYNDGLGFRWLEKIASILGMLLHFNVSSKGGLINLRRPQKAYTTYPTSPAVAGLLAEYVLKHLFREPIPTRCRRVIDAERYAKRALQFKLLDPSMESGYLLLQTALWIVRLVHRKQAKNSKESYRLSRALLERLCSHCLWGIDRNPLAIDSVNTLFSLLAIQLGIPYLKPQNLIVGNSLEYFNNGKLGNFDGVFNNPPWDEVVGKNERVKLKKFSTIKRCVNTYVAFSELTIRCLKSDGIYGLVLPSQSIAIHNCYGMRELILNKSVIDHLVLLPRAAFADSTVRGLVILGRVRPGKSDSNYVQVTRYPIAKSFVTTRCVKSFKIPLSSMKKQGGHSWAHVLNDAKTINSDSKCVKLSDLATIVSGVRLYAKGRGVPPQTDKDTKNRPFNSPTRLPDSVAAARGRDVCSFHMKKPTEFVKFGPWLAQPGQHGVLRYLDRVFVRELCGHDGRINAAIAIKRVIPLHGVLSIIPKMVDTHILVAILNSRVAAKFVQQYTASFSKVDFQRITVGELGLLPVPFSFINARCRHTLGLNKPNKHEISFRINLTRLTRKFISLGLTKSIEADRLRERIEYVIAKAYTSKHP